MIILTTSFADYRAWASGATYNLIRTQFAHHIIKNPSINTNTLSLNRFWVKVSFIFASQTIIAICTSSTIWNWIRTQVALALLIVIITILTNAFSIVWCLFAIFGCVTFDTKIWILWFTLDTVLVLVAQLALTCLVLVSVLDTLAFCLVWIWLSVRALALFALFTVLGAVDTVCNRFWAFDTLCGIEPEWIYALTLSFIGFLIEISVTLTKSAIVLSRTTKTVQKYITLRTGSTFIIKSFHTSTFAIIWSLLIPVGIFITSQTFLATFTSHASIKFGIAFGTSITIDKFIIATWDANLWAETCGAVLLAWGAVFL